MAIALDKSYNPLESVEKSLIEMKSMRKGEIPKKTWRELKRELKI